MPKRELKSLPFSRWPEVDKRYWHAIMIGSRDAIDANVRQVEWTADTVRSHRQGYSRWLGYLANANRLGAVAHPADRVTPERLRGYLLSLDGCSSNTLRTYFTAVYSTIKAMAPDDDWAWLLAAVQRLFRNAVRPVVPEDLPDSGDLFRKATAHLAALRNGFLSGEVPLDRQNAVRFRDGLVLAVFISRALRLKNMTNLTLGRDIFRETTGRWVLNICRNETKNRILLDFMLPDEISVFIDFYMTSIRKRFLRGRNAKRFWINRTGNPLEREGVYLAVVRASREVLGTPFHPHRFRYCAATMIALRDPDNIGLAARMLGHSDHHSVERYYNKAGQYDASRRYRDVLLRFKEASGDSGRNPLGRLPWKESLLDCARRMEGERGVLARWLEGPQVRRYCRADRAWVEDMLSSFEVRIADAYRKASDPVHGTGQ